MSRLIVREVPRIPRISDLLGGAKLLTIYIDISMCLRCQLLLSNPGSGLSDCNKSDFYVFFRTSYNICKDAMY